MGTRPVLVHLDEELHAALKKAAAELNTSVSDLLREGAAMVLAKQYGGERARSLALSESLSTLREVLEKLADGHVLVPREVVPVDAWGGILDEG